MSEYLYSRHLPHGAQTVKHLPAMQEISVRSPGWEDPPEKEMATHSSTLAWKIPWMKEPGRLQSLGLQRVGHDWATSLTDCRIYPEDSPLNWSLSKLCKQCCWDSWYVKGLSQPPQTDSQINNMVFTKSQPHCFLILNPWINTVKNIEISKSVPNKATKAILLLLFVIKKSFKKMSSFIRL